MTRFYNPVNTLSLLTDDGDRGSATSRHTHRQVRLPGYDQPPLKLAISRLRRLSWSMPRKSAIYPRFLAPRLP